MVPSFSLLLFMYLFLKYFCFILGKAQAGEGQGKGGQRIQSGLCADGSEPDGGLELTNREIAT